MDDGGCRAAVIGGQSAGEQFVEHHADRENIRAIVRRTGGIDDFRARCSGGCRRFPRLPGSWRSIGRARPKSPIFGWALRSSRMFDGLDVAVEDAVFVGMGEAVADAGDEADDLAGIDGDAVGGVEEGFSRHILHDDVEHAVDLAEVVNADEIGVIEAGHGLGFGLESGAECGVLAELAGQDLDGDGPVQRLLDRAIDRAHAAGGDQGFDFITREKRREVCEFPEPGRWHAY